MLELGIDNRRFKPQEDAIQRRIDIECEFHRQRGCFSKDHKKSMVERAAYDKYIPHAALMQPPMQPSCTAHASPIIMHAAPMHPPCSLHEHTG